MNGTGVTSSPVPVINNELHIFCVWDHPDDLPQHWALSVQIPRPGGEIHDTGERWLRSSLEEIRAVVLEMHPDAIRLERNEDDPPFLVETWV